MQTYSCWGLESGMTPDTNISVFETPHRPNANPHGLREPPPPPSHYTCICKIIYGSVFRKRDLMAIFHVMKYDAKCGTCLHKFDQVRDMTAFVIHCCIGTHIKITIQGLYCNLLPYCDQNTDSPFLFDNFFYNPPLRTY